MCVRFFFPSSTPCDDKPDVIYEHIHKGQERAGTFEWVSFARAVYRGAVPHACEAGRGGGKGGAGTERGGAGTAEEEAQRE
jgi:hypothetical protein